MSDPNKIGEKRDLRTKDGKFAPGNVANPNGRPTGTLSIVAILKEELLKCPPGDDKRTYVQLLVQRIMKSAIQEGNDQQIKNILQYVEGMPDQKVKLAGDENNPILVKVSKAQNDPRDTDLGIGTLST